MKMLKNKTYWYDEKHNCILEENTSYRRIFKKGQSVAINSILYSVIQHNRNADESQIVFVKKEPSKRSDDL
jgi:hypothetical protein